MRRKNGKYISTVAKESKENTLMRETDRKKMIGLGEIREEIQAGLEK